MSAAASELIALAIFGAELMGVAIVASKIDLRGRILPIRSWRRLLLGLLVLPLAIAGTALLDQFGAPPYTSGLPLCVAIVIYWELQLSRGSSD